MINLIVFTSKEDVKAREGYKWVTQLNNFFVFLLKH